MAQCEADDGFSDVTALLPFVQKHLLELRHEQAAHGKGLRQAEAHRPTNLMAQQELAQLTTDLRPGEDHFGCALMQGSIADTQREQGIR